MKKALVLSGGSIKGAFQAGVLADLLTSNKFMPDAIYGTSVGSLNGIFIAERAGRASSGGANVNWPDIGNQLQQFWQNKITSFKELGKKKGGLGLLWSILFKNFVSFIDMSPLYQLLNEEFKIENLRNSPVKFYACAVNMVDGKAEYASADTFNNMMDYVIASTAIPLVMPARMINNEPYVDGGIREVAPLSRAINDGATDIISVVCQPRDLKKQKFNWKDVVGLMNRDMDIVTNETVNNDLDHCHEINEILKQFPEPHSDGPLKGKKHINLLDIRPEAPVELDLENFNPEQIRKALEQGWHTSQKARQNCDWINQ